AAQVHVSDRLCQGDRVTFHNSKTREGAMLAPIQSDAVLRAQGVDGVEAHIVPGAAILPTRVAQAHDQPLGRKSLDLRLTSEHGAKHGSWRRTGTRPCP